MTTSLDRAIETATAVRDAGGRALIVGGWVRDRLLGHDSPDIDIEVFGIERVKLVYKVKVGLPNADGLFKPGMPAEARLRPSRSAAVPQGPFKVGRRAGSVAGEPRTADRAGSSRLVKVSG